MIPLLIVSKDRKKTAVYIQNFISDNKIPPYNVISLEKEESLIKIDQIRSLISLLIRAQSEKRVVIVFDFDTAKSETQNAFLKTLEEKSDRVDFIIVIGDKTAVLPTIISRCKIVSIKSSEGKTTSFSDAIDEKNFFENMRTYSNFERNKNTALALCDDLLQYFSSKLPHAVPISKKILEIRRLIDKNNINPQLAIDQIFITLHKMT